MNLKPGRFLRLYLEVIMEINKLLTPYSHNAGTIDRIKFIVIHYVGATGGAKANCEYYAGGKRGASAHYYVGFQGEIWQSVEDKDIARHCGGKKYPNTKGGTYHGICTNANSIGIEMCVRNKGSKADTSKDWYFEGDTVTAAIELTKELMAKYNIPIDHVIRHYDVVGKICPNPYVYNTGKYTWKAFKAALAEAPSYDEGWQHDEKGWWYQNKDGSYPVNGWAYLTEQTGGTSGWYLFDESGYMLTGYQTAPDGRKYLLCPDIGIHEGQCMVTNDQGALMIVDYDMGAERYLIKTSH